jgi:hypothetical protein
VASRAFIALTVHGFELKLPQVRDNPQSRLPSVPVRALPILGGVRALRQWNAAALGAVCALATPAMAAEPSNFNATTTRDLVALCAGEPDDPLYAEAKQFCYGFLAGVAQFHRTMVEGSKIEPLVCPQDAVSREQLVGVFLDWAKANPQAMDELPAQRLERAAAAQWPCISRSAAAPLRSGSGER